MKTPEGKIKKQIVDWLRSQGAYVFAPVQQGYGASTLDLLVCFQGRFIAVEVKAAGNRLTPRQYLLASQIGRAGGMLIIAHDLQDIVNVFA